MTAQVLRAGSVRAAAGLSGEDNRLRAEGDTVTWSYNLWPRDDPAVRTEVEPGVAPRHGPVREDEIGLGVPTKPVRAIPVSRKAQSSGSRLLPGMPNLQKPQRRSPDASQHGVFQPRVPRQITDQISEVVSVATAERVVEAAKEGVAAQSPLDGGLTQLPQGSLAFGVRDADRRQGASGVPHGSKCKSISAWRPCLPRRTRPLIRVGAQS